jgi:hypothetical protein
MDKVEFKFKRCSFPEEDGEEYGLNQLISANLQYNFQNLICGTQELFRFIALNGCKINAGIIYSQF